MNAYEYMCEVNFQKDVPIIDYIYVCVFIGEGAKTSKTNPCNRHVNTQMFLASNHFYFLFLSSFFHTHTHTHIYIYIYIHLQGRCPRGVMVEAMDCGIVLSRVRTLTFWQIPLGKAWTSLSSELWVKLASNNLWRLKCH